MVAPFIMTLRPIALVSGSANVDAYTNIDEETDTGAGDGVYNEFNKDDDGVTLRYRMAVPGTVSGFKWPIGYCDQLEIGIRYASNVTHTFGLAYGFSGGTSSSQTITTPADSVYYDGAKQFPLISGPEAFGAGGTAKDYILIDVIAPATIATGKWVRFDYLWCKLATRPLTMP